MTKKRLTFRIVEGSSNDFDQESFNKDYIDVSKSKKELMVKYGLSEGQWTRKSKYAREETGFSRLSGKNIDPATKHITKCANNKYRVQKGVNGFTRSYGTYKDLKTAQTVRDILMENNWDDNIARNCRQVYGAGRKHYRTANQYMGSPLCNEALKKYSEFKKLYLGGEHSYYQMLEELGFTKHQYNICLSKLRETHPMIRKKCVRSS